MEGWSLLSSFVCSSCGNSVRKWVAKCPKCGSFSSFVEQEEKPLESNLTGLKSKGVKKSSKKLYTVEELKAKKLDRLETGIGELDRVLGGGFVPAEVVLFAGQPGAGKSSLALHVADKLAGQDKRVLYSSGEESEYQIGLRAERFKVDSPLITITNETNLEALLGHCEEVKPDFLIVDSLQTLASEAVSGSVGSLSQSRECSHLLTRYAKSSGLTMLIISQLTKSGDFSGENSVQHIVDATILLENDSDSQLRFLRATKNRFGATSEVGIFIHEADGFKEVADPTGLMMTDSSSNPGVARSFLVEGIRSIPVEVQSLTVPSGAQHPRRQFSGVDYNRGQIVCAVLDKFCKTQLFAADVYSSTISGLRCSDPMADLALAASLLTSKLNRPSPVNTAYIGEVTLTGQVRGSNGIAARVEEAIRLGFRQVVIPKGSFTSSRIKLIEVDSVVELKDFLQAKQQEG